MSCADVAKKMIQRVGLSRLQSDMYRLGIILIALALFSSVLFAADSPLFQVKQTPSPEPSSKKLDFTNYHGAFSQTDINSKPELLILSAEATNIISKLKTIAATFGLNFTGATRFLPVGGEFTNVDYDGPTVIMDSNDHEFDFSLDRKVTHYCNLDFHKNCTTIEPTTKISHSPKWNSDQALTIAQTYLRSLYDTSSVILSRPKVRYQPPESDLGEEERVYPGYWAITWVRTDGKGHDFEWDCVTMQISERWGLTDFSANLTLPYLAESGPLIPRQTAIEIAKKSHPVFDIPSSEISDYTPIGDQLKIAEPNYQPGSAGRLAWIVFLHPLEAHAEEARNAPNNDQEVTVDAYNGKVIGGMKKDNCSEAIDR